MYKIYILLYKYFRISTPANDAWTFKMRDYHLNPNKCMSGIIVIF